MDENIYELINESKIDELDEIQDVESQTYLVFSINSKKYGVSSNLVRELLRDVDVFPLPFVPAYIDGVLNRYGDPYVVIDPATFFNDKKQNNSLFLVFNDDNKICIRISDVFEFQTISLDEINRFTEEQDNQFFEGTFKYEKEDVLILKKDSIIERVEKDFERM